MTSIRVAFIRHGPTKWNRHKFLQGRSDQPLDEAGCLEVRGWKVPPEFDNWPVHVSPLVRTRQTAEILFGPGCKIEQALIETDFGEWEGRTVADLRAELGSEMVDNEARGLDFLPPSGESPRMVQERVIPLLAGWAKSGRNRMCVAHKGVIRAMLAKAYDWPMIGKAPQKLRWDAVHVFKVGVDGSVEPDTVNIPMTSEQSAHD